MKKTIHDLRTGLNWGRVSKLQKMKICSVICMGYLFIGGGHAYGLNAVSLTHDDLPFELKYGDDNAVEIVSPDGIPYLLENRGVLEKFGKALVLQYEGKLTIVGRLFEDSFELCSGKSEQLCSLTYSKRVPGGDRQDNSKRDSNLPVYTFHLNFQKRIPETSKGVSHSKLVPYTLASPNQEGAGSCLYMAHTGAMEIILNRNAGDTSLDYEGARDISERFVMNAAAHVEIPQWRTDTIDLFNQFGGALLNRDYPYRKGWFGYNPSGQRVSVDSSFPGARYSTAFNWIDDLNQEHWEENKIEVPSVQRTILYADPEENQWNTGVFEPKIIDQIKAAIEQNNAPVLLMYNHFGYWHANLIVGFNDEEVEEGCPFVDRFQVYMAKRVQDALAEGGEENLRIAEKFQEALAGVENSIERDGGCQNRGTFYVRDSIYDGEDEPVYDYDSSQVGDETLYSKRIIKHSYNWPLYMGNHAYVIH